MLEEVGVIIAALIELPIDVIDQILAGDIVHNLVSDIMDTLFDNLVFWDLLLLVWRELFVGFGFEEGAELEVFGDVEKFLVGIDDQLADEMLVIFAGYFPIL